MATPKTQTQENEEDKKKQIEKTQEFLDVNNIPYAFVNGSIFIIGEYQSLNPNGTLAFLPYCSRSPRCPVRGNDERKSTEFLTTTDECQLCDILCDIGKIFQLKGQQIAEVRVIGSSHNIKDPIGEFQRTRKLTHVIVVCCVSNLAKYLQKGMNAYKNVTVIYTPVVGNEICKSPISYESYGKDDSFPNTLFYSDSLVKFLVDKSK